MKISGIKLFRYHLPFVKPINFSGTDLSGRDGIIIQLKDSENQIGLGETSPLPGFSVETIDDVIIELKNILPALKQKPTEIPNIIQSLSPSVIFGIESAFHSLKNELLTPEYSKTITLNGLITTNNSKGIEQAKKLVSDGYQTLKIKVGRQPVEDDISFIKNIVNNIDKKIKLRLDANRAWSYYEALKFAKGIHDVSIEYIEEPLQDINELEKFALETNTPVAIDESLTTLIPNQLKQMQWVQAIIIKPTLLGSINKSIDLIKAANEIGIKTVFSSSFESSVGLAIITQLASSLGTSGTAVGLDTGSFFSEDLYKVNLFNNPFLSVDDIADKYMDIDYLKLEMIAHV